MNEQAGRWVDKQTERERFNSMKVFSLKLLTFAHMLVLIAEELSELWCSAAGGTPLYIHHDNDTVDTAKAYDFNNGI